MKIKHKKHIELTVFALALGVLTALTGFSRRNAFEWNWAYFSLFVISSGLIYRYFHQTSGFDTKNIILALFLISSIIFRAFHLLGFIQLPLI